MSLMVKMLARMSNNVYFGDPTSNEALAGMEMVRRFRNTVAIVRILPN